jgi:hypothetical protein
MGLGLTITSHPSFHIQDGRFFQLDFGAGRLDVYVDDSATTETCQFALSCSVLDNVCVRGEFSTTYIVEALVNVLSHGSDCTVDCTSRAHDTDYTSDN